MKKIKVNKRKATVAPQHQTGKSFPSHIRSGHPRPVRYSSAGNTGHFSINDTLRDRLLSKLRDR